MKGNCCIIGAGPCRGLAAEGFRPGPGDYIVAADGGLRYLEEAGVKPDLIVGDFDTLGYEPDRENVIRLQVEKDWTDTFVAMEKGMELGYRTFEFYGCLGGKLEHTIANLQHLKWLADRGLTGVMKGENRLVTTVFPSEGQTGCLVLEPRSEGLISVFSLTDRCSGVTIRGLKYTLEEGELTSSFPLGVSNEFIGKPAEITVEEGVLLVVMEKCCFV